MSRRLLGPVGGPITFFLIAALVFAGLGWVTVVALRVEQAQRDAAAQAELGNNLRVALWRLDGRMLPALGVEDSRPFYHYTSADPLSGSTTGPTPLLAAPLPDWMKLHVQLDPAAGWESPQVLPPEATARVSAAWPDLPLFNNTPDRAAVLDDVKEKYAARAAWELLAARERAIPADARPFAAPLFDPLPAAAAALAPPAASAPKPPPPPEMAPVSTPSAAPPSDTLHLFGWTFTRRPAVAGNQQRLEGRLGASQGAQQPQVPPSQLPAAPQIVPPPVPGSQTAESERRLNEYRNRSQTIQRGILEAKNSNFEYPPNSRGNYLQNTIVPAGDGKAQTGGLGQVPGASGTGGAFGGGDKDANGGVPTDKTSKDEATKERALDELKKLLSERPRDSLLQRLACAAGSAAAAAPRPVPPAEDRPPANVQNTTNNFLLANSLVGPPVVNIHLGSMRPQWIAAADGTETLLLVRAAKLDTRTVYQGVILDWPKLERVLKDEVKDLFPKARLVPVKDASGVSPDRAMTALPVQLDPGPRPDLPPAGWTPLRIGLALAWVAALVAFAAVGLSGWSLVDLAERRIRFVSAVTHELRTPLTSLRLYLDLLMSGMIQDEAKRQEYLNTLATESDRLHRLIDNVLDFAKLEKRRANGDMKPVKVSDLLDQLQATWTDRVAADGKELVVACSLPADAEVCTDAAMVHQIVGNLIDNARKYTRDAEDKHIWLRATPLSAGRIAFEVEDRGAGIPAGERKSIFKPFRRGAHADTTAGGAGLGLALAKQWAEMLGGTVAYRPADGAPGACFRLELPVK